MAKVQNWNGSSPVSGPNNFQGGSGNKSFGTPHSHGVSGMQVTVSGCGDKHQVIFSEYDMNKHGGQNTMVFQDGTWWFHHLYGRSSVATINEVPLSTKAVGYQDIYWLSDYSVKNGMHQLFHGSWQLAQNQWYNQSQLCPNGGEVWPMGMHNEHGGNHNKGHRYACVYDKTESKIRQVENGTSGKLNRPMYEDMVNRLCSKKENLSFALPGGSLCAQHNTGKGLAEGFCKEGNNFTNVPTVCSATGLSAVGGQATYNGLLKWYCGKGGNIKEARCDALSTTDYNSVAEAYCKTGAGRGDAFCTCYNVVNGVCDSHSSAAGCAKKKQTFDKLVAGTPDDQKNVWSGMESCFGRVCTGAGKYIPPNTNQNCNKTVNVCIQDIDIGSMTDSNIQANCDIKSSDGSSVGSSPSVTPDELEAAKAAVAAGEPGAEERLKELEDRLKESEESGFRAYIPMSLEDLKTNRKKQGGALGGVGSFMIICICLILLVVIASKGGRRSVSR